MKLGKRARAIGAIFALSLGMQQAFAQTLTASFTVSPSKSNVCQDSVFNFTSTTTYTGSGTVTYTWDFGDGSLPATGSNVNKTYSSADTFIVKLIALSSDVLSDTATDTVIIHPRPTADYSYTGLDCARNEFIFKDESSISSGSIASYEWTFPDRKYTTAFPIYLFNDAGTFPIKLVITTDKGCKDSVTKTIVIKERPIAGFSFVPNCENADVTFTDTTVGTYHTVKWDFGDGTTSTLSDPGPKKFATPGIHNIKLVVTDTVTGCVDSVTKQVPVYDKAIPKFIFRDFCTTYPDEVYIINQVDPLFGEVRQIEVTWDHAAPGKIVAYKGASLTDTLRHRYGGIPDANKVGHYKVSITIYTTHDCKSTYTDSLHIYNEPTAGFVLDNACENTPVTFYDTSKVATSFGGKISKWLWIFGDKTAGTPNISTSQNPSHIYKAPGEYDVKLYVYNEGDCVDSVEGKVAVGPLPDAGFSFDARCKKTPVPFTDASYVDTTKGDTIVAWEWNFGDGSTPSTQKNPTHSYAAIDTYKVILKVTTNKGCSDTISQSVIILPDAVADFTVSGNCERAPIIFTEKATPPSGKSITGYLWDFGDLTSDNSNSKSVSHIYANPGTYIVSLRVTTIDGCLSDPAYDTITVIPSPKVKFNISPTCVNKQVFFKNLTTLNSSETIAEYRWDFGDGTTSTQTTKDATHTYNATGVYTVSLVAVTTRGCLDRKDTLIEVSPIPKSDFTFDNVCYYDAVQFADASTIASGSIANWTWKWGDGKVTSGTNNKPSHKYDTPGTYNVTLVITSAAGCKDSIEKTITTFPKPEADFRFVSHCADSAIEFYDLSTMTGGSVSAWKWDFNDGNVSYDQNPTHVYGGAFGGIYEVTLTAISDSGCIDIITKPVNVYRLPKKTNIFIGGGAICARTSFPYEEFDPDNTGWLWDFGDGSISTTRKGSHTYPDSGYYNLRLYLVNKNGCRDSFFKTIYVHPLPIVKFGWKGGCVGVDVVFRDSSTIYNKKRRRRIDVDFGDNTFYPPIDSLIFRHNYSTPGTYTITYTVTENSPDEPKERCSETITKQITIYDNPKVGFKANTVCFGESTQFFDTTTGAGDIAVWRWDFGDGTTDVTNNPAPLHTYASEGTYLVNLYIKNKAGCEGSYSGTVTVLKKPKADFRLIPNPVTILDPDVIFTNTSSTDVISYKWTFGDGEESDEKDPAERRYPDTGHYVITLTVRNANGCSDTLIDTLKVKMGYTIHPPNILTLNGDEVNDEWKPLGEGVENYEIVIMDRWGQQVFHSTDFNESWKGDYNRNGVLVPEGVYVFQIKIVDFAQEEVRVEKGTITVIK